MENINTVTLSGNVVKSAEMRGNVLPFSVAVNESWKNQGTGEYEDYASFIDCALFGNRAKALARYLVRGQKVLVSGRLHQARWEDKDGNPRRAISVYVDNIELVGRPKNPEQPVDSESIPF